MAKLKSKQIFSDEISNHLGINAIKNFVIFDNIKIPENISLNKYIIFKGIIFGICIKGNATIEISFKEYELEKGSIYIVLPNIMLKTIKKSDDFLVEVLFVSSDFMTDLSLYSDYNILMKMGHHPCISAKEDEVYNFLELHSLIVKYYNMPDNPLRVPMVKMLLCALIIAIGGLYFEKDFEASLIKVPRQIELTERFFILLKENYITERNISFYADKLFLTPKYLSSIIKKITGHSIMEWINEAVILEAKIKLKTTDLTVLQISEELNFGNPSFFSRYFKQYTGFTPLAYRNGE